MLCNYPLSLGDTLGLQAGHSSTQPSVWCCVISPQSRCNTDVQMTHRAKLIPPLYRHWLGLWAKSHNDVHFYVRSRLKSGLAPLPLLASHRHSSKCACWSLSPRGQSSFVSAESCRGCLPALSSPCHQLSHPLWWLRSAQKFPGNGAEEHLERESPWVTLPSAAVRPAEKSMSRLYVVIYVT